MYKYFEDNIDAISDDLSNNNLEGIKSRFDLLPERSERINKLNLDLNWDELYIKEIDQFFDINEVLKTCRNTNSRIINIIQYTIFVLQKELKTTDDY